MILGLTSYIILATASAFVEQPDSLSRQLGELVVTAARPGSDVIPAQTLTGEELKGMNSNSVADALR